MRVATTFKKPIQDCAVLSNLEKTRLKCFILYPAEHAWRRTIITDPISASTVLLSCQSDQTPLSLQRLNLR
jgi:hypothetical protein